uniref:Uncharacterized protein n=1 Tax=Mesorhizobium ciceri TaxID=39645 RepID=A0A3G8FVK5_9HYPH|nr:hypothetical protein [Mesorhizobium ciceri]
MAIALNFVAERPDHLAMTEVAALAHIDVAPDKFERRIGAHAFHLLDRIVEIEERRDLDDAADRHHEQRANEKKRGVLLDDCVFVHQAHYLAPDRAGRMATGLGIGSSSRWWPRMVLVMFQAMIRAPERYMAPPMARMT